MDSERLRRALGLTLVVVALVTVVVWAISQFVRPLLPASIDGSAVLFFAALVSTVAVLAGFKGIVELVNDIWSSFGSSDTGVWHNLPQPDYERFIGRQEQIETIQALLLPTPKSRHFVITIDGVGGVGKSALALQVAYTYLDNYKRLPKHERFLAIIWTTAKKEVLTGEGILPQHQRLHDLDDIHATIAGILNRPDISNADRAQCGELVRHALTKRRTLLIVDNLETIDDETIKSFIREVPEPTKVIVTSRHRLDIAYPVRLEGMKTDEAREFIKDEEQKKGVQLSPAQVTRLIERTGGVPLAIVWSIAQMGLGYEPESVIERLGWATTDIAKFCFKEVVNQIRGQHSYKLLMVMAYIGKEVDRQTLGDVSQLPPLDRDDGLVVLEKLSLVNKKVDVFLTLPLTLAYMRAELDKHPELIIEFTWPFLKRHLARVTAQFAYTRPLASLNRRPFDTAYVPPTLFLESMLSKDNTPGLEPLEFIKSVERSFVFGLPGSGKTALLQYLALQASIGNLDLVPLYVQLRSLKIEATLLEHIVHEFEQVEMPAPKEYVTLLMTTGKALLLLDGLDEVGLANDPKEKLIDEVETLALNYPLCKIVLTSRPLSVTRIPSTFVKAEISPFTDAQIEGFIRSWFADNSKMADALIRGISQKEQFRDLTRYPLTLLILCSVYSEEARLPERRVDLYFAAIERLIGRGDKPRNVLDNRIKAHFSPRHQLRLLSEIAAASFTGESEQIDRPLLERLITSFLSRIGSSEMAWEDVLQIFQAEYGLIVEQTVGMYSFVTLGFQEFFTALYYSERDDASEELARRLLNPRWGTVLPFFCSLQRPPNRFLTLAHEELDHYLEHRQGLREVVAAAKLACLEGGDSFDERWRCVKEKLLSPLSQPDNTDLVTDDLQEYLIGCDTYVECLKMGTSFNRRPIEEAFLGP